ncbi:methyl-accepting chemotaxis protein [Tardiphaga sp.]|uniref:methyl-accepting chemotaxis protein n=1 Tax=Tardiphaga sp. TaxID=1926292 RepID=UPI0025EB5B31|nr:methyl-accepting chemotaxis protein [Tardiphaga sp.]
MFASLSIRAKISSVIAVLLLAMTGMVLLAVGRMQMIDASATELSSRWLPSVRVLGALKANTITYRTTVRAHMLGDTAAEKEAMEKRLIATINEEATLRATYESLINSAEERGIYNGWRDKWAEYMKSAEQVLVMSRNSIDKSIRDAQVLNQTTVNDIGKAADAILEMDIALINKAADAAGRIASENYRTAFVMLTGLLGVAAVLGIGIGIYLVRDVSRGIASIVTPMQALGAGDLTAMVPHQGMKTEIGSMGDALQIFKQALIDKKVADEAAMAEADSKIERGRRVDGITRDFEAKIGEIVDTVSSSSIELEASAGTLTATAERAQQLATLVATASEAASTNVQSVASATEEMASSVNEISRQVQESSTIANQAVDQARKTNDRVGELAQAASRIGDVVELINTIAGQTNLLALNATIEAARAGEAGRGFAVVASEVKALAEQTAKATGEISAQISGIQAATQDSVGAIREISDTIGRMSEIASTIASAVEEQGAATQEISRNVQLAAQGTMQVSSNITDVQRGASATGSASSQVFSAARSLSSDSNRLKVEVGKFLNSVRSA